MKRAFFSVLLFGVFVFCGVLQPVFAAPIAPGSVTGTLSQNPEIQTPETMIQAFENCFPTNQQCWAMGWLTGPVMGGAGLAISGYPKTVTTATGQKTTGFVPGAISMFGNGIVYMASTKPASGADFTNYIASRIQVPGTEPAYAATVGGVGFTSLQPVLQIWTAFRNVAYVIFAVIFVAVGIMIMLRFKIDPKTVATVQTALPKIVMALILVTFSYAIAGFLIDIMYVMINLFLAVLSSIGGMSSQVDSIKQNLLSGQTIFSFFLGGGINGGVGVSLSAFYAINAIIIQFLGNVGVSGGTGVILGAVGGSLGFLIVAIAILWALFKTWLVLLGAYVNIILAIIFAPLQLMLDAVPGQNQFQAWVRTLLANLMTFPLVIGMMFVALALAGPNGPQWIGPEGQGFVPPLIGGNNQQAIQALIGIGILLTIPKALEILQQTFKAPAFKWAGAWTEAVKFGWNNTGGRAYSYGYGELVGKSAKEWETYSQEKIKADLRGTPLPNKPTSNKPNILLRNLPSKGQIK